jgi:hypothetical protein
MPKRAVTLFEKSKSLGTTRIVASGLAHIVVARSLRRIGRRDTLLHEYRQGFAIQIDVFFQPIAFGIRLSQQLTLQSVMVNGGLSSGSLPRALTGSVIGVGGHGFAAEKHDITTVVGTIPENVSSSRWIPGYRSRCIGCIERFWVWRRSSSSAGGCFQDTDNPRLRLCDLLRSCAPGLVVIDPGIGPTTGID